MLPASIIAKMYNHRRQHSAGPACYSSEPASFSMTASSNRSFEPSKPITSSSNRLMNKLQPMKSFKEASRNCTSSSSSSFQDGAGSIRKKLHSLPPTLAECTMLGSLHAASNTIVTMFDEPGLVAVAGLSNRDTGLHAVAKHTCDSHMAAAEDAAMHTLRSSSPLLAPPLAAQRSSDDGIVLVSEYAGHSIEGLQHMVRNEPLPARVKLAMQLLACMVLALEELSSLPVPQLHRDFKAGNITYDVQLGVFRLIDFGLMIAADKSNFFPGCTISHVAPEMATPQPSSSSSSSSRPLCTAAGMAAVTSPAADVWALFLTALQLVLGDLPAQLDYETFELQHGEILGAHMFCELLATWNPNNCQQLKSLSASHPEVADLFRRGLAADPAERITVQQALQHPALAEEVAAMRQRVADVAPAVQQHREVIRSLCGCGMAAAADADADAAGVPAAAADAVAGEEAQLMPATPALKDRPAGCIGSSDSSNSSGSSVDDSDASCSSKVIDSSVSGDDSSGCSSSAGYTQQRQFVEAEDTRSIGCFGGMSLAKFCAWCSRKAVSSSSTD